MRMPLVVAAALLGMPAGAAVAQDAAMVRSLAATCANCHGTQGRSVGGMESLAGMPKDELVRKMNAFRSGARPATIMHQLAKGYSDQQIDQIAAYFAAQR